ncbi:hypothetical protein C8R45DRAFT_787829, partial [Mycena sanguinolenta]
WTLGEFLYQIFDHQMVSSFLRRHGKYTLSDILTCWMTSPDGVLPAYDPNLANMYCADTPYSEIRPVR